MADKPMAGLTLHSNFARHWSASSRDPVVHAERTMAHMEVAAALQQAHMGGLEAHLARRNMRPTEEQY